MSSERLGYRILQPDHMPERFVAETAARNCGSKLFDKLLKEGRSVVEIEHRKQRTGRMGEFPAFDRDLGVEHNYDVLVTPVQYRDIVLPRVVYRDPEPVVVEKVVERLVEVQAPPARPWWERCATWVRTEWELTATNPGLEYEA